MNYNKKKISIFNLFAYEMHKKKIAWIVTGGLNDFPIKIGRDLDIIVKDYDNHKNTKKIYINCLKKFGIKKIVVKKSFYGEIIFAYDSKLNYYELHLCKNKIRSGYFSIKPDWNKLCKIGNFYIDPACYIFKNNLSTFKKVKIYNYRKITKPKWLNFYLNDKIKKKKSKIIYLFNSSLIFLLSYPITFLLNIFEWFFNKIEKTNYVHSSYFLIKNKKEEKKILNLVKKYFSTSFYRGIICIDNLLAHKIFSKILNNKINSKYFKFFYQLQLFLISLIFNLNFEKMCFCYSLKNKNNLNLIKINYKNRENILDDVLIGIKKTLY